MSAYFLHMTTEYLWKSEKSLQNGAILLRNQIVVGFVTKPDDTETDKNAWRTFVAIGVKAQLIAHTWSLAAAKSFLEQHVK